MNTKNIFSFLYFIVITILNGSCQQYYKVEWLELNPANFCTQQRKLISLFSTKINKYEIDLNRAYSAIVLSLKFNATQVRKIKNECKFVINTEQFDKNGGIYLNILKMKLRQQKYSEKCIDSIQIKYNGNIKQQICGTISNNKLTSYEDLTGKLKISLNIDSSVPFLKDDDFIEFQFVATAFKHCSDKMDKDFNCKPNNAKSCIDKRFVNDSIVNCIEPYCNDEPLLGCTSSSVYITDSFDENSANENIVQIFLSAVTSLILTMLTCGTFIWLIYKIKRCCSPPSQQQTQTRRRRRHNTEIVSTSEISPSAPPKDDLPPSYSELFPSVAAAAEQSSVRKQDDSAETP
ncbi:hypothetical protein PVAND_000632 [Polypedilum vanderplanki]|uniref:Transmembrane protein n=1 Tax=Polypedilum vanderplanki TaxID=319348 RepID=A0A9J6BKF0_POLVA|nr:hypothetical protein PVAND_000632 [Polypedilum vanderplanki]